MKFVAILTAVYGLLVAVGGLVGYLTVGSLASLVMGSVCGALLFAGGLGLYRLSILAFFVSVGTTVALAGFFGFRYYVTQQMMPVGMMALVSLVMLLLLLTAKGKPRKK